MDPVPVTNERLLSVLGELSAREPIFHRREVIGTRADFEAGTAEDFWEVTASGHLLSRDDVWEILVDRYSRTEVDEFESEGWEVADCNIRELVPDTYLLTYTLLGQGERVTRRLTIWQRSAATGWRILFHQGTVVEGLEAAPTSPGSTERDSGRD